MGKAAKSPAEYNRIHHIGRHAIERLREYTSADAYSDGELGNVLDEILRESLPRAVTYFQENWDEVKVVPVEKALFNPGEIFVLAFDAGSQPGRMIARTVLTKGTVEKQIEKGKFIPYDLGKKMKAEQQQEKDQPVSLPVPPPLEMPAPTLSLVPQQEEVLLLVWADNGLNLLNYHRVPQHRIEDFVVSLIKEGHPLNKIEIWQPTHKKLCLVFEDR